MNQEHPSFSSRIALDGTADLPLFRLFPRIKERLPWVSLGQFPTPVEHLEPVGREIGLDRLFIKRDDQTGAVYGGNKVRKLEFLLAEAVSAHAREVITMGYAGSNHALATAIYARQLGLKCASMLLPQANAHYVRNNLLAGYHTQAQLRPYSYMFSLIGGIDCAMLRGRLRDGTFPRFIPAGGSSPLGLCGYVNAALELKDQIAAGLMPEPDLIYVPMGSMGTSVGLTLGLRVAGLKTKVITVRVIEKIHANSRKMLALIKRTAQLLQGHDSSFPRFDFFERDFTVRHGCLGDGYAHFTQQGMAAAKLMRDKAGIAMNGSYSAKAFAALMGDAARGELKGKTVLFWNTYNSRDLSAMTDKIDYHDLPRAFHKYFEEDVQTLDILNRINFFCCGTQ